MLFGYPVEATDENWLHDCLCAMVHTVHENLDAGQPVTVWPDIIPAAHREDLKSRTGLRSRLQRYIRSVSRLSAKNRQRIWQCLADQNQISLLISCGAECDSIDDLPKTIRKPTAEMFEFAFELLTELGVRDRQYKKIYHGIRYKVCPFCGCEYFDALPGPREDLDHYLPKSRYPFAAANLRNLIPMGMKCNQRYKKAKDILCDDAGNRRRAFDPYDQHEVKISLVGSVPFSGADEITPAWKIEFDPDSQECETWNDVFDIRERLERDVLKQSFKQWLRQFAEWFVEENGAEDLDDEKIRDGMQSYANIMEFMGLEAKVFLRAPVFRMLHNQCVPGNARLLDFMRGIVTEAVPQGAAH